MITVLVVDDSQSVLRTVGIALRTEGIAVLTACQGVEALDQLTLQRPDVILLDVEMPMMGGPEFLRTIRAIGDETPVLLMSAYDEPALPQGSAAQGFISKPFDPDDLLSEVTRLAAGATG